MIAKDFMTAGVISCKGTQTVEEAASLMARNDFSIIPIVDDNNHLIGIITESDFVSQDVEVPHALAPIKNLLGETHYKGDIESIYARAKTRQLKEVMTTNPVTVNVTDSLNSVVSLMEKKDLKRFPVLDDQKLVGIITRKNLLKAFLKS